MGTGGGGSWKVKVSHIECSSYARGIPDCNQYLTGVSGTITSYNHPTQMLQSTVFTYCVRRELGTVTLLLIHFEPISVNHSRHNQSLDY